MKKIKILFCLALTIFLVYCSSINSKKEVKNMSFQKIEFNNSAGYKIKGDLFLSKDSKKAVIFSGNILFSGEKWHNIAQDLKSKGVSSITIDFDGGNTHQNIIGAKKYLQKLGVEEFVLIAACGGSPELSKSIQEDASNVKKALLLAPTGSANIDNTEIEKLFVASQDDPFKNQIDINYNNSKNPKIQKIYEGAEHAEYLFESENTKDLNKTIIDFVLK